VIIRYVAYLSIPMARRVRRLGLEAQRKAVAEFVKEHGVLIAEYAELESGKCSDKRLELQAALTECAARDATPPVFGVPFCRPPAIQSPLV
jgi:DNA invertase Pin-like site-specific DNA recombinase